MIYGDLISYWIDPFFLFNFSPWFFLLGVPLWVGEHGKESICFEKNDKIHAVLQQYYCRNLVDILLQGEALLNAVKAGRMHDHHAAFFKC